MTTALEDDSPDSESKVWLHGSLGGLHGSLGAVSEPWEPQPQKYKTSLFHRNKGHFHSWGEEM